jgi:hypothetical protein
VLGSVGERASLKLVSWLCGEAEEAKDDDKRRDRIGRGSWIRRDWDGQQQ